MSDTSMRPAMPGGTPDRREYDEQVADALVTAGALVALADRHAAEVERDALVQYVRARRLVPSLSERHLTALFEQRVRRLEQADFAQFTLEALRPVPTLCLSSSVIELAERVAGADRHVHPYELHAIQLVRLIARSLPHAKPAQRAGSAAARQRSTGFVEE